jgi:hypothetical protein
MATWQEIFGVDPPIRGSLSEFAGARDAFETMRADAQNVVDQFANFSDPTFVEGNLNDAPGALLTQMLSTVDDGLHVLPDVAEKASGIFSDHYDRLAELRDAAADALARASTAWDQKNELLSQQSNLQSQIDGLNTDLDDAEPDADITNLDTELSGAQSSLSSVNGDLDSVQSTLDAIYGNDDSEYNGLVGSEHSRDDATTEALHDIDLGALEDPGFWDKVGDFLGSVAGFLGGVLESIANLLEAFVTGDWATFFWELKKLLDVALLVLGTIALFTGIGGPLGVILIAAAIASFAVNSGLYLTQTPNPQTGQTVGLTDVVVSGVGAAFAGVSVLRVARMTTVFNRGIQGVALRGGQSHGVYSAVQRSWYQTFRIANAPGLRNGALPQFVNQFGRNVNNGMTWAINQSGRWGQIPYRFAPGTTFAGPLSGAVHQPGWLTSVGTPASWTPLMTTVPLPGSAPDVFDRWSGGLSAGGYDGFNSPYDPGSSAMLDPGGYGGAGEQGTPMFGPERPSPQQIDHVLSQSAASPDVYVIPANP